MEVQKEETQKTTNKLVAFEDKKVRRIFYKGEWYFSILDIVEVLTETPNPRRYWPQLKAKLVDDEGFTQLLDKIEQLKLEASDGKKYLTDTVNRDVQGFEENQGAARAGGKIAGNARHQLEQESGKRVVSQDNFVGRLLAVPEDLESAREDE